MSPGVSCLAHEAQRKSSDRDLPGGVSASWQVADARLCESLRRLSTLSGQNQIHSRSQIQMFSKVVSSRNDLVSDSFLYWNILSSLPRTEALEP